MSQFDTANSGGSFLLENPNIFDVIMFATSNGEIVSSDNPLPVAANIQIGNLSISFPSYQNVEVIGVSANININNFPSSTSSVITEIYAGSNQIGNVSITTMPFPNTQIYGNTTVVISNTNPFPVSLQLANTTIGLESNVVVNNWPTFFSLGAGSNVIGNVSISSLPSINLATASLQVATNDTILASNTNPFPVNIPSAFSVNINTASMQIATNTTTVASNANPVPVSLQISNATVTIANGYQATQPISGSVSVTNLVENQLYSNSTTIISNANPLPISLQISNAIQNVSITAGLPTGANTIGQVTLANTNQQIYSNATVAVSNTNPLPVSLQISNSTVAVSNGYQATQNVAVVSNTVLYGDSATPLSNSNPLPISIQISNTTVTIANGYQATQPISISGAYLVPYTNTTTVMSNSNPLPVSIQISNAAVNSQGFWNNGSAWVAISNANPLPVSATVQAGNTVLYSNSTSPISNTNPLPVSATVVPGNTVLYSNSTIPITNAIPLPISLQISNSTVTVSNGYQTTQPISGSIQLLSNSTVNVTNTNPFPVSVISGVSGNTVLYSNSTVAVTNAIPLPVSIQIANATIAVSNAYQTVQPISFAGGLPTGANTIGTVQVFNSPCITNPSSTLTRPSDTNVYANGDLIASSTTNTSIVVSSFSIITSGGGAIIPRVRLKTSATTWGGNTIYVNLYTAAPTYTNGDNGAWQPATGSNNWVGQFQVKLQAFGDGCSGQATPTTTSAISVANVSGTSIYWDMQIIGTPTPVSGQTFMLVPEILN